MHSPFHGFSLNTPKITLGPWRRLIFLLLTAAISIGGRGTCVRAGELPVLHLRKAATPPPMVQILQDPSQASGWYSASPTWFGDGGLDGNRTHVEVLATYDDKALYLAFLVIDKSPEFVYTAADNAVSDRNLIWIQTPQGRTFGFIPQLNAYYPAGGIGHSGEMTGTGVLDITQNALPGWWNVGWTSGFSWQNMVTIPWSDMSTSAPTPGSRWRINFVNCNQTSSVRTAATVNVQQWAPGSSAQPDQWGYLAFDDAKFTPPAVSPEATLTLRPATGFGSEVTLSPGDNANTSNVFGSADAAIVQSDWNDWDPIQYELKEFMQFDLSMIPRDRVILSATLDNHFRAPFEGSPTDQYVHVERLAGPYDRNTVTMLTAPLPIENGDREFVPASAAGSWVHFDVSDTVSKAFASGASQVSLALAGSAGDTNNGKAWDWSFGRADWYDGSRPQLHITFGKPGVTYPAPVQVGSLNATSVAGSGDKNRLTNGTFRYGTVEGVSNTTYWMDAGSAFTDHNIPLMQLDGDANPVTGDPAMRLLSVAAWRHVQQTVTGLIPGQVYTLSGWVESAGIQAGVGVNFYDAAGNTIGQGYAQYNGGGDWRRVQAACVVPAATASAAFWVQDQTNDPTGYALFSDLQLEAGAAPTGYSETMGVYYPDHPRADAIGTAAAPFGPRGVAVGPDGTEHVLWTNPDGRATLQSVNSANQVLSQHTYGPYAGWTAQALSVGPDGTEHVLWTYTDQRIALWNLDARDAFVSNVGFGPYAGWTARRLAVGPDDVTHVLWTFTDGRIALWNVDTNNAILGEAGFGPYAGWSAQSLTVGPDNITHILWDHTDGRIALWNVDTNNTILGEASIGPYAGWTARDIAAGPDDVTRILWTYTDGHMALWNVDANNAFLSNVGYGPYAGWSALGVAVAPDATTRLLWGNVNALACLWTLNTDDTPRIETNVGPLY